MLRVVFVLLFDLVVIRPFGFVDEGLDGEHSVGGGADHGGIVEVEGSSAGRGVVVVGFVECGPGGVVAVGEAAVGDVEFVGHDEVVGGAVDEGGRGVQRGGRVFVDPVGGYVHMLDVQERGQRDQSGFVVGCLHG